MQPHREGGGGTRKGGSTRNEPRRPKHGLHRSPRGGQRMKYTTFGPGHPPHLDTAALPKGRGAGRSMRGVLHCAVGMMHRPMTDAPRASMTPDKYRTSCSAEGHPPCGRLHRHTHRPATSRLTALRHGLMAVTITGSAVTPLGACAVHGRE